MLVVVQAFLMIVMGVIFQYVLMERRFSRNKTFLLLVPFVLVIYGLNAVFYDPNHYVLHSRLYPLTVHLPIFLLFIYLSKFRGFCMLFNLLTAVFLCSLISLISTCAALAFRISETTSVIVRLILFVPILIFVIKIFRAPYLQMLSKLKKGWALFCLIPAFSYALNYLPDYFPDYFPSAMTERIGNVVSLVLSDAIVIAAYGVILTFFKQAQKQFLAQNEQQLIKTQVRALENQLLAVQEAEKTAAILRHDMRHYTQNIASILQRDGVPATLEFIGKSDELFELKIAKRHCVNQTINAILHHYLEIAEKQGINVITRLDIAQELPVDAAELSIVFANALENALQACAKMEEGADKTIEIVCISKPHFVLEITNTFGGEVRFDRAGLPLAMEEGHGLGSRSIEAFAKKNKAILDYQAQGGLFKLRMLLNS